MSSGPLPKKEEKQVAKRFLRKKKLSSEHCQYYLTKGINKQQQGYKVVQRQNGTHYQQFTSRNKRYKSSNSLTDNFIGIRNKEPNIMLHWLFTLKNNLEVKHSLIR